MMKLPKEIKGGDDVEITVGRVSKDVNAALEELNLMLTSLLVLTDADKPAGAAGAGNEGDAAGADPVSGSC